MSKTSVQLATQDADLVFNEGNEMIETESFMVATIVARPSWVDPGGIAIGVCLSDDLNTRSKAVLFKQIAEQLAVAAVEEDVALNARSQVQRHDSANQGSPID